MSISISLMSVVRVGQFAGLAAMRSIFRIYGNRGSPLVLSLANLAAASRHQPLSGRACGTVGVTH